MIYSLGQIADYVKPVAEKYKIPSVCVFGSYARGDATENSDIDILIDRCGSDIKNMYSFVAFCSDLENVFMKNVDVITVQQLEQHGAIERIPYIIEAISKEKVRVYGH